MLLHFIFTSTICIVSGLLGPPEVNTSLGKIIGKWVSFKNIPVKTFQGIPYAEPPTAELRFKRPQPIAPWEEPLVADELPPSCVQYSTDPYPWVDRLPGKTQDCLYLNIWVPGTVGLQRKKAVMFWIHSGGFAVGSSRLDVYNGIALATLGDVIVATINYRLGTEGFLYSGTSDAPGNMGLYDILEALKWVKSNIRFFGGDEDNITVFGHSAGAIAIGMLMISPLARGLFVRAVMESGSAANLDAENNNNDFELTQKISEAVGCADDGDALKNNPEKVVQCLRGKSAFALAEVETNISRNALRGFYPRYGDDILPYKSRQAFIDGKFEGVELLIGVNQNEGATFIARTNSDVFGYFGEKNPRINKSFGEYLVRKSFQSFPDPDAVVQNYLGQLSENDYNRILFKVQSASADYLRVCPSIYLAESVAKKGSRVLFYYFAQRPFNTPYAPWMGVVHFDEVFFVFGYPLRYPTQYTYPEKLLSMQMIDVWSSFAKFGSSPLLAFWPPYSSTRHRYVAFTNRGKRSGEGPHLRDCEFFRPFFGF